MRKATSGLSMRGSRKKQQTSPPNVPEPKEEPQHNQNVQQQRIHVPTPQAEQHPAEMKPHHHRRKPSHDETAALTSKNYRLAKELSDLRVRHREECKNVTRLTMENMNLASRCREAISHVAMLKKELAMHQRRAAEALALQREQTQRIASNLSTEMSRLSQSGSEDDGDRNPTIDLERIMSPARPPTTPRKEQTPNAEKSSSHHKRTISPRPVENVREQNSDLDEDDTVVDTVGSKSPENETTDVKKLKEASPKVYSTPNRNRNPDRWKPKIDQKTDSPGMFPSSASPKVGAAKPQNYNEEFPSDVIANPHISPQASLHSRGSLYKDDVVSENSVSSYVSQSLSSRGSLQSRSIIGMNSIDAFEASFDTTFPADFSTREDSERKARSVASASMEIYNPFSPSPARPLENREMRAVASRSPHEQIPPSPNASPIHKPLASSPTVIRTARVSDAGVFGNPVTPEEKKSNDSWSEEAYRTPPHEVRPASAVTSVEPKRPEKTASAAARARYEKAMQPRTSTSSATNNGKTPQEAKISVDTKAEPVNDKMSSILKGSPSALLKRIQQRRMSKQINRQQSAPESVSTSATENEKNTPRPLHERQKSAPEMLAHKRPPSPLETIGPSFQQTANVREAPQRRDSEKSVSSSNGSERPFDEMEDTPAVAVGKEEKSFGPTSPGGAQTISERLNAIKGRRAIRQPMSYAEPALNTKLRRGDEFFPKTGKTATLVTPEQVSHADAVIG